MAASTKTRKRSSARNGSGSNGNSKATTVRSRPASPFPARFANRPKTGGNGPHPGELLDFKKPTGKAVMDLADYFPEQSINAIHAHGSICFHALGDSGVGTPDQHDVADAMSRDVDMDHPEAGPAFMLHLGDILYGPDKMANYAGKFYRPNENYHNLIFALPGNHDGEVRSALDQFSLQAYFENFCQPAGKQPALGVQFGRAMPHQPGAYWRLKCPFADIVALYSGTGENYGTIAHAEIGNQQKAWLEDTLKDIDAERGNDRHALILAVHHPPYSSGLNDGGFGHPGNPDMLKDIDDCCTAAGIWPDAVLSAHAHSYQRYMRTISVDRSQRVIPYLIAGGGGIRPQPAPAPVGKTVGAVNYANGIESYGFLTMTVSPTKLTTTYTRTDGSHRDLFESITIDLASGRQI